MRTVKKEQDVVDDLKQAAADQAEVIDETAQKIEDAVNAWWSEHVHNSPVSQVTTAYNHLVIAKDKLIEKIKEATK